MLLQTNRNIRLIMTTNHAQNDQSHGMLEPRLELIHQVLQVKKINLSKSPCYKKLSFIQVKMYLDNNVNHHPYLTQTNSCDLLSLR